MIESPPASVRITRRLEWIDTDAAGRHHNSVVWRLVEAAEVELLRGLGLLTAYDGLARVRAEVDHAVQLAFDDLLDVDLAVESVGTTSLRYRFAITRGDVAAARGALVVVRTDPATRRPVPWTDAQRAALLHGAPAG